MSRGTRARALVALVIGIGLMVIGAVVAVSLPTTHPAVHWSIAWAGLDLATAVCALLTGLLLMAGDPRAALSASGGAALLVLDAWFDVCTAAPGVEHVVAMGEALLVELPLAGLGLHVAADLLRDRASGSDVPRSRSRRSRRGTQPERT